MSQLRKSASFRSRIPVKNKLPIRRCCSPAETSTYDFITKKSHLRKQNGRRYSSSSFSSSDESNESEVPFKSIIKPLDKTFWCTSTDDAISINGLLDSVSNCGSFSDSSSPNKNEDIHQNSSSYESLDKYSIALEKMNLTENVGELDKNFVLMMPKKSNPQDINVSRTRKILSTNYLEKQNENLQLNEINIDENLIENTNQGQTVENLSNKKNYITSIKKNSIKNKNMKILSLQPSQDELISSSSILSMNNNKKKLTTTNLNNLTENNFFYNIKNNSNDNNIILQSNLYRTIPILSNNQDILYDKNIEVNRNCKKKRDNNLNLNNRYIDGVCISDKFLSRNINVKQQHQTRNINKKTIYYNLRSKTNQNVGCNNEIINEQNFQYHQQNQNKIKLEQESGEKEEEGKEEKILVEEGHQKQQQHQFFDDTINSLNKFYMDNEEQNIMYNNKYKNNKILSNYVFDSDNKNIQIYNTDLNELKKQKIIKKHNKINIEERSCYNLNSNLNLNNYDEHIYCNTMNDIKIFNKSSISQNDQQQQEQQQQQQINFINYDHHLYPEDIKLYQDQMQLNSECKNINNFSYNIKYNNNNIINNSNSFEQLNIIGIPITNSDIYENYTKARNEQFSKSLNKTEFLLDYKLNENISNPTKNITEIDMEKKLKYIQARRRPLPQLPLQDEVFPPKNNTSYRSDCELSGSYVSLECPSPPGPPISLPESRRDPQARLSLYLKTLYTDLALKEPIIPPWAIPLAPGALSPARLEPELRLHSQSHGFSDSILVDQLLLPIHTKEGNFLEPPRRLLIECPQWASRTNLSLRILYSWAKEPPWPPKGAPIAIALFIPLNELKRTFANYIEKELLLKGPMNPFANGIGGFTTAWNSLEALGPKLLIILDGYDNQRGSPKRKGKNYPSDVHDLLEGKLFPEARVIITTSSPNYTELLPLIQRHIRYEGLTWGRSASLLGGGQWNTAPTRLLDTVQECNELRRIVRTPLGCLALAAIFEATAGDLPTDDLDVIESVLNCVAPETSANNVAELGRLALFCLKMKRSCITLSEIRMYCSSPESSIMGCLDKSLLLGRSAKKKAEYVYNLMCPEMAEFLAANYVASLANRPGLLAAEITGLSIGDELDPDLLKVIKYAMGLLGPRSHILLSKLTPLWLTPQNIFSLALAGGHSEDNLSALCDILGISKHPPISPLESKPIWVQVRTSPTELMGWGMALKSPTCTLKNLELAYQLEKHILLDSRNAMDIFLDSINHNESVSTLRITSLIENEVKDSEINYLATCVSRAIMKPRLENFELILTLLEEDPPILKLQPVVSALCRSIPRQQKLTYLQLDLGLSTSQLVQICATLDKCPNITRLSLPHLRCERGAVSALATLLTARPLSFLAIPSCWGARDDPPSSSGVSMGSGSGSSTATSGLIKQGSLTGVPSPRSYPPGLFSSLPRGVYVPTTSMGRSATLPRQLIEPPADKRSCDSVISKTWYPTPACEGGPHNSGTLHDLLLAARESYSKLHGLDLTKAQLSLEDSMCLGETVRISNTLHTLKLEGSSRLSEVLPSILGASESPCLQMLSIGSPRLNLEDSAISMSARALTSCSTLRLLSLDGWGFRIENSSTLSIIRAFLSLTSIRELSLANCRLQIGTFKIDSKILNLFESRSVVVLKLSAAQVNLMDSTLLRGPQLLPCIGGFPCLRELDISAPARSGLASTTHSSPLIIDDKSLIKFFQSLHSYFSLLNTLKICNWVIHFDDPAKTLKILSKSIRNSPLSHLKLDGISVLDKVKKIRIESQFLHCFISSLPYLRWMGISLSGKKEDQITAIGNAVLDLKGYEIDIKLSESTIEHAKLMAQAISLDGKFDIKVSTFGTSSGILIHAEKSGTRSLNRKHKD